MGRKFPAKKKDMMPSLKIKNPSHQLKSELVGPHLFLICLDVSANSEVSVIQGHMFQVIQELIDYLGSLGPKSEKKITFSQNHGSVKDVRVSLCVGMAKSKQFPIEANHFLRDFEGEHTSESLAGRIL